MKVTSVNHASVLIESGAVRLICDPWLDGPAFNNGWKLFAPTKLSYEDFARVTHIWFSHEHPDHFSPSNLRQIPEQYRKQIEVLFHETRDKRVVNVCQALGFQVQELPESQILELAPDFKIMCGREGQLDSWLAVFADGKTLLNMNDCVFEEAQALSAVQQAVGKVELLLTQFSYANWVGNTDDAAAHQRCAGRKRQQMKQQVNLFQPAALIPFASYVYFCHAENFFMNSGVNHIAHIYEWAKEELKIQCVVLYPGDEWEVGSPWDSAAGIEKYEADFARALACGPAGSAQVSLDVIQRAAEDFLAESFRHNNAFLLRALPPAVARLSDLGIDVEVSFRRGVVQVKNGAPDIILSSDSLLHCLKTDWGGDALVANGRFQAPVGGISRRFFRIFRVPSHNSYGETVDFSFLGQQIVSRTRTTLLKKYGSHSPGEENSAF